MGTPAVVAGDRITATCAVHQIPSSVSGAPQPAPPLPFSAPLVQGLAGSVLIGGKPAAVVGSSGLNTPPHAGLHLSDPFIAPSTQLGTVVAGSGTVLIENRPAAYTGAFCTACAGLPGTLAGSVAAVLIGG